MYVCVLCECSSPVVMLVLLCECVSFLFRWVYHHYHCHRMFVSVVTIFFFFFVYSFQMYSFSLPHTHITLNSKRRIKCWIPLTLYKAPDKGAREKELKNTHQTLCIRINTYAYMWPYIDDVWCVPLVSFFFSFSTLVHSVLLYIVLVVSRSFLTFSLKLVYLQHVGCRNTIFRMRYMHIPYTHHTHTEIELVSALALIRLLIFIFISFYLTIAFVRSFRLCALFCFDVVDLFRVCVCVGFFLSHVFRVLHYYLLVFFIVDYYDYF